MERVQQIRSRRSIRIVRVTVKVRNEALARSHLHRIWRNHRCRADPGGGWSFKWEDDSSLSVEVDGAVRCAYIMPSPARTSFKSRHLACDHTCVIPINIGGRERAFAGYVYAHESRHAGHFAPSFTRARWTDWLTDWLLCRFLFALLAAFSPCSSLSLFLWFLAGCRSIRTRFTRASTLAIGICYDFA